MATAFKRGRDGSVHAFLEPNEKALLRVLAEQLAEIVGPSPSANSSPLGATDSFDAIVAQFAVEATRPSGDPVYERLFPRVHLDDADIADEFDRAALESLRSGRAGRTSVFLEQLSISGNEVGLTVEEAHIWLTVLTDLRLMIGTTLKLTEDDPRRGSAADSAEPANHETVYLSVYEWLSWLQESLVGCFLRP